MLTQRADSYRRYGAPEFLRHLRGEFSLVLYDDRTGDVIAAKDRFGIKPLFWTIAESGGIDGVDGVDSCDGDNSNHPDKELWIAAEMKAFLPLGWKPEWDVEAIAMDTWSLGSNTTFKGVKRVRHADHHGTREWVNVYSANRSTLDTTW